jgi:5-methylthioadenosine/S-adenosylhomocysteine deaminase
LLFRNISFLDKNGTIIPNQNVLIEGKTIQSVGNEIPEGYQGAVYEGQGKLLMPGFVNSHSHTPMTLMRGYGENMVLSKWLNDCIFPFEARLQPNDVYYATLLGIAEMVRFGIVSTTDMYYFIPKMSAAFVSAGMKANLSHTIVGTFGGDFNRCPACSDSRKAFLNYHGAGDGLIQIDVGIHAEYTTDEKAVWGAANLAKDLKTGIHVHLSETKEEVEGCKTRRKGLTPTQYFDRLGVFDVPTVAAHGIWLEDGDLEILSEKNVSVVTCPKSNLKLASGLFDYARLKRAGINIAIGTDSVASNNNLNMLEEIKIFSLLQKYRSGDPTQVKPWEVLQLAISNGYLAQRRTDCGIIAPGYRADLIVVDMSNPYWQPTHNILNNLIYSAAGTDVVLTMIDGEIVYRDGEYLTIDIEQVKYEVETSKQRILTELNNKSE